MSHVSRVIVLVLLLLSSILIVRGKFDPYADNGGTTVAIAGPDYFILASDTRLSDAYVIKSRNITRIYEISDGILFSASGCLSDFLELIKVLQRNAKLYKWENRQNISVNALSHLLAFILYSRRTFPYFAFCIVAGLDKNGQGAIYRYDAVGSFERVRAVCVGKGEKLIQPLLDEITNMEQDFSLDSFWSFSESGDSFTSAEFSPNMEEISVKNVIQNIKKDASEDDKSSNENEMENDKNEENEIVTSSKLSINAPNKKQSEIASNFHFNMTIDESVKLIKNIFESAAEREISIGDGVDIWIVRKNNFNDLNKDLNKDLNRELNRDFNKDICGADKSADINEMGTFDDTGKHENSNLNAMEINTSEVIEIENKIDQDLVVEDNFEKMQKNEIIMRGRKRSNLHRHFYQIERKYLSLPTH